MVLRVTQALRKLKVRGAMHVASAEAAKHCEQVNLADVSEREEHIECEVSAA